MNKYPALLATLALLFTASLSRAEVTGDYVEARTASVFAGACHFNGELVTTGRDAVVAWSIKAGEFDKIDLAGVRAIAVVSSDANLSEEKAVRKSELIIDSAATQKQADALVAMLKEKSAVSLGTIVSVKRAAVAFTHAGDRYTVASGDAVKLDVKAMPDGECCKQPNNVWYSPLVKLNDQKVGYTTLASYAGGAAGDAWRRGDENSAFYGVFHF